MKRLREILARKAEIRTALQGEEKVDLKLLQDELRGLTEEETELRERYDLANSINENQGEFREIPNPSKELPKEGQNELRTMTWDSAIETEEYRQMWAKEMMSQSLSSEERDLFNKVNDEYRAFTHTTENSQILIPKTVAAGIWKRAEDQYPLWSEVRKLRVSGNLTMIKSDGNKVDSKWYSEDQTVDTDQLGFGQMDLTGCELAKAIQVTWKLKKMALPEFEAYIIREIGDRMGVSLSTAVYVGKGKPGGGDTFKPEPRGIKTALLAEAATPQFITYVNADGIKYANLTAALAKVHSSYSAGVTIYANSDTVWNSLANLLDANGRPYFVADVQSGGVGRIFGKIIKEDAGVPKGELLIGNVNAGYLANINEDITMYREDHVRARLTDYMGYAIVDGDVVDNKAFVIVRPTTPIV